MSTSNNGTTTPERVQSTVQVTRSPHDDSSANGKRLRRERSYAGRAHAGNVGKKTRKPESNHDPAVHPNVIMQRKIHFPQKTYHMISNCDADLAGWTNDGEMFVVKDTDRFAKEVIPMYFDHSKFSSFARQLNFYGFRKIQDKPIRNSDIDISTVKHVKFYNNKFKRNKPELLCKIRRLNGRNDGNTQEQQQWQINELKEQIASYERAVGKLTARMDSMTKTISYLIEQSYQNQDEQVNGATYISRQLSAVSLTTQYPPLDTPAFKYTPNPTADVPLNSDISPNLSKPTLSPHPKMKSELPPGRICSVPPIASNVPLPQKSSLSSSSRGLSLSSFLRSFSNASLDDRQLTTLFLDDQEINTNETDNVARM